MSAAKIKKGDNVIVLAGRDKRVSVACPLTKKWARTLDAEFKSGACHAGLYETSIMMAAAPEMVDDAVRGVLPPVPISRCNADLPHLGHFFSGAAVMD